MANSDYPEILQGQISSPALITAQQLVRSGLPQDVPLLYALLGSGTPPYKMSPRDAAYVPSSPSATQRCANCRYAYQHVTSGTFICSQIRDPIRPKGWCRLWRAA